MAKLLFPLLFCALCFAGAEKKKSKTPDVQVVECKARRDGTVISLDGRVRNSGHKAIKGLTLVFNFREPDKGVVTSQKTEIDEPVLEPGKESVFHVELVDPVRAVDYLVEGVDGAGRDLRVANPGPFSID